MNIYHPVTRQQKPCLLFRTMCSSVLKTKLFEFLIYAKEEQLLCNFPLGGFIFSAFSTSKHSPGTSLILLSQEDHPRVYRAQGPDDQSTHSQIVLESRCWSSGKCPIWWKGKLFFLSLLIPSFLSPSLVLLLFPSPHLFFFFFSERSCTTKEEERRKLRIKERAL